MFSRSVHDKKATFSIFPNPINEHVIIETSHHLLNLSNILLLDINGQSLSCRMEMNPENRIKIHTDKLEAGVYFIKIISPTLNISEQIIKF